MTKGGAIAVLETGELVDAFRCVARGIGVDPSRAVMLTAQIGRQEPDLTTAEAGILALAELVEQRRRIGRHRESRFPFTFRIGPSG